MKYTFSSKFKIILNYCYFNIFTFISVSVHCKDTRIAVEVNTNRAFNGRIYALGRSETCNIAVINSDKFRLDLTMGGQDCNTQSVVSIILLLFKSIIDDYTANNVSIINVSMIDEQNLNNMDPITYFLVNKQ